jgi:hypothetical protein
MLVSTTVTWANEPRTPHTLSRRSATPADIQGDFASPLLLNPKQKAKAGVSEDVGRYTAECICDLIRAVSYDFL